MDSLAGYSSGSDNESPARDAPVKSINTSNTSAIITSNISSTSNVSNIVSSSSSSSSNNISRPMPVAQKAALADAEGAKGKSKKKKLDISFLPKHIQDALLRGEGVDSDEEDKSTRDSSSSSGAVARQRAPVSQDQRSGLLGLLPKPKSEATMFDMPVSQAPAPRAAPLASSFNSGIDSDDDLESDLEAGAVMEAMQSVGPVSEPGESSVPDFSQRMFSGVSTGYRTGFSVGPASLASTAGPAMGYGEGQEYDNSYAYPQADDRGMERDESMDTEGSRANKRKRERDLEIQMLKGDMSGSGRLDAAMHSIDYSNFNWNASEHNMQVEREHEIKSVYKVGSSSAIPTKMQSSKHQINSLVLRAQETELRNLNKQTKSRSQAAAKYGW